MAKVDFKKMTGKELYEFYITTEGKGYMFEYCELLFYSTIFSLEKTYKILEEIHRNNKKLVAYYPGIDKIQPEGELIGSIIDGCLYLVDV